MTYEEGFSLLKKALQEEKIDDYAFEAACLFEKATGINRQTLVCHGKDALSKEQETMLATVKERRLSGEPLQYILGEWDFCDLTFSVGEGVLIPRPETEILVEYADAYLKEHPNAVVYDLCAGSGAIGLTVAAHNKNAKVYLFEKYEKAFSYLEKNRENLQLERTKLLRCDVLEGCALDLPSPDLILSNPPYIPSKELPTLQREVQKEPQTALDGGKDGLLFYRAIYEKWFPKMQKGGELLFECGDGQTQDIINLFAPRTTAQKQIFDFNDIDRAVQIIV